MRFTLRPVKPHATHFTGTNPKPEISVAGSDNLPEPHDGHGSSVSFNSGILLHNATGATLTTGAANHENDSHHEDPARRPFHRSRNRRTGRRCQLRTDFRRIN